MDREQLDDRGMVCDLDVLEAALTELTGRVEGRNLEKIRPAGAEAVTVEVFAQPGCRTPSAPGRRCRGRRGTLAVRGVRKLPIAFGGYRGRCCQAMAGG